MNWRCADRIKPLLDALLKHKRMIMGDNFFSPFGKMTGEWISGATETAGWLDTYGVSESRWMDWMEYGLRTHNNNMREAGKSPYVKSTRTIQYTMEDFAKTENRDRYLIGVEDE